MSLAAVWFLLVPRPKTNRVIAVSMQEGVAGFGPLKKQQRWDEMFGTEQSCQRLSCSQYCSVWTQVHWGQSWHYQTCCHQLKWWGFLNWRAFYSRDMQLALLNLDLDSSNLKKSLRSIYRKQSRTSLANRILCYRFNSFIHQMAIWYIKCGWSHIYPCLYGLWNLSCIEAPSAFRGIKIKMRHEHEPHWILFLDIKFTQ